MIQYLIDFIRGFRVVAMGNQPTFMEALAEAKSHVDPLVKGSVNVRVFAGTDGSYFWVVKRGKFRG